MWPRAALPFPEQPWQMLRAQEPSSSNAGASTSRTHTGTVASGPVSQGAPQSSQESGQDTKAGPRSGRRGHLLGTRLMARRGRSTRTVRMADRLTLCPSREYSIMLGEGRGREVQVGSRGPHAGELVPKPCTQPGWTLRQEEHDSESPLGTPHPPGIPRTSAQPWQRPHWLCSSDQAAPGPLRSHLLHPSSWGAQGPVESEGWGSRPDGVRQGATSGVSGPWLSRAGVGRRRCTPP